MAIARQFVPTNSTPARTKQVRAQYGQRTAVVGTVSRQQPVEDVVVTLETRLLERHARFLQQVCSAFTPSRVSESTAKSHCFKTLTSGRKTHSEAFTRREKAFKKVNIRYNVTKCYISSLNGRSNYCFSVPPRVFSFFSYTSY